MLGIVESVVVGVMTDLKILTGRMCGSMKERCWTTQNASRESRSPLEWMIGSRRWPGLRGR